ncbi:minor capsid protein [Virgibacillus salexigens]|uniref:minor capsid protein n=1 Tax=Virgibacillus salexigens TaxID=61016 RepID=UPI00190A4352|nr:minor capsid protein [Virgibacillus salexigens]
MPEEENYWVERERDNITLEQMKDEEVAAKLREIIEHALREIEKEINAFYTRYAGKNNITPSEAKKRVSEMDVQAFEKTAARYVKEKNFSDKANEELYTYNTKMRINRQELLKRYLNAHLVAMADEQVKTFQAYLEQAAIAEVARQAGILGADIAITASTLKSLVAASFYNATWSTRIWNDMKGLRNELETIINSSIIRGVHPDRFVKQVRERFDVTTFEARRLLITETARVQTESMRLSFQAVMEGNPKAEYEFVAKLDNRTTKRCRGLNGKRFKVKDMKPGVNAAPMHPFCRSSAALILGDWREKFFKERKGKYTL